MKAFLGIIFFFLVFAFPFTSASSFTREEVSALQEKSAGTPRGERIAFFASSFIGTPYDPDPMGEYVTNRAIVADERVDCMYHVFRSAELALSKSPEEAEALALDLRFLTKGRLGPDGKVENYSERFEYGEDMIRSGKWGRDITALLGRTEKIPGSRGIPYMDVLPKDSIEAAFPKMKSGDIVFFIKDPEKRKAGEIVGHIGIIDRMGEGLYLIHASGSKTKGGLVKKLPLKDYISQMGFIGVLATRFE